VPVGADAIQHALTQLLDRQESFLVGVQKSFDTFADMGQLSLQTLLTLSGWIRGSRRYQATIQFLLYQSGVFQQADHLSPDDLIQEAQTGRDMAVPEVKITNCTRAKTWRGYACC
jgi:hypothetical protein